MIQIVKTARAVAIGKIKHLLRHAASFGLERAGYVLRVLIVDDEPMLREELQESLELEDFEVTPAENVDVALNLCNDIDFDIVVTDLKMPMRGGLELIEELKSRDYGATCFVVSGHGAESNREKALEFGAAACFAKPLDVDELINAINEWT